MKWVLILVLMAGNGPNRMVTMEGDMTFATEQECREVQQELLWDEQFVSTMFSSEYIIIPSCVEIESIPAPRLRR